GMGAAVSSLACLNEHMVFSLCALLRDRVDRRGRHMNISEALKLAGQIAGIGGISLAVFLVLFREIIRKTIFPNLTKHQGYRLLTLIVILVALIALAGIGAWLIDRRAQSASIDANTAKLDQISRDVQALKQQIATDVVIPQGQIEEELRRSALERQDSQKV